MNIKQQLESKLSEIYYSNSGDDYDEYLNVENDAEEILQSILKAIMEKLNILMPDKRIEEIEGNLNIYLGETHCTVCGADPRRQKIMIESVIKEVLTK